MAFVSTKNGAFLMCLFLLVQLIVTTQAQPSVVANKRPYRGTGGWTMNSIGYNAGLDALQKIFGKRDGLSAGGSDDMSLSMGESNIRAIVSDFISFLELKESGLLGPSLLGCIRNELQSTVDK